MSDQVTIACPRCGAPMVERVNSLNNSTFMGCSAYPTCTATAAVPAYLEVLRSGGTPLPGFECRRS